MMRKALLLIFAVVSITASAQRFAYVDTEYILENIPEFKKAQEELNKLSAQWQKEVEEKYKEIDELNKSYFAEQVLLTEDMKRQREEEIKEKERLAREFQKSKFGLEGELFRKRQELIKPIQDKVYNAVKELATSSSLDFIFDKAGNQANMLYADPKFDKSDSVLRKMGIKKGVE
ncbi:MAG TPA: OmpH family outer membrane protein [Luteibaculaceae bacterium]|nr:OmpH family outer membrane protein [Luteibaculaceae bacterium]